MKLSEKMNIKKVSLIDCGVNCCDTHTAISPSKNFKGCG